MCSFLCESWFWRGTQSAIFYYVSGSPCLEWRHKKQRRTEAERAERERTKKMQQEVIDRQPGQVRQMFQPVAFQTNEEWTEEIVMGPGPPKGWKKDKILQRFTQGDRDRLNDKRADGVFASGSVLPGEAAPGPEASALSMTDGLQRDGSRAAPQQELSPTQTTTDSNQISQADRVATHRTSSHSTTSSSSSESNNNRVARIRPSMERRISTAMDNIKDTIRSTMNSERWNWKRYDRDDEILTGFTEKFNERVSRMSRMWDRATNLASDGQADSDERKPHPHQGRKRAATNESDRYDYQRVIGNPEINEMHPPINSQLPATRDQAAWMLLPPPSAAVMEGKARPQDEPALRWPLAKVARNPDEWAQIELSKQAARYKPKARSLYSAESDKTPDLSNSSSEAEESLPDGQDEREQKRKGIEHHLAGWAPVIAAPPKAHMIHARSRKGKRVDDWWSSFE